MYQEKTHLNPLNPLDYVDVPLDLNRASLYLYSFYFYIVLLCGGKRKVVSWISCIFTRNSIHNASLHNIHSWTWQKKMTVIHNKLVTNNVMNVPSVYSNVHVYWLTFTGPIACESDKRLVSALRCVRVPKCHFVLDQWSYKSIMAI